MCALSQVDTYIALLGLPPERKPVPFWVIALSIFGGAILLMLVVLMCYLVSEFSSFYSIDMIASFEKPEKKFSLQIYFAHTNLVFTSFCDFFSRLDFSSEKSQTT